MAEADPMLRPLVEPVPARWDDDADVVVVGCGFAGAVAAIRVHDAGGRVLLLEKAAQPGGISVCSAGGLRIAKDADAAFRYLVRTNGGTTPEPVLRALADGMAALPEIAKALGQGHGAHVGLRDSPANYPFDGYETFGFAYVDELDGFDYERDFPHVRGNPEGARLFALLQRNLAARGIVPRCLTTVETLIRDASGAVVGVRAAGPEGDMRIRATGGVILACGGFEGNEEMQRQFWPMQPVLNAAYRGNTGDGIRMAQEAGAALWHMWHFHGSYGFRHADPGYPFGIRTKRLPDWRPGEGPRGDVRLPWVLLDRFGRRFMNEYEPYLQDTGARPMARYAPEVQDFQALPAWLVSDEAGAALWPFGRPTWHEPGVGYEWSRDNSRELENGILKRADSLEDLADAIGADPSVLADSMSAWNDACAAGQDAVWSRPPSSMVPIRGPKFIYAPVWPIISNTQGGPVHDEYQRVIHAGGSPIPGLYAAGECGSAFGFLYMSGGNIAECFIGGGIAAAAAMARAGRG